VKDAHQATYEQQCYVVPTKLMSSRLTNRMDRDDEIASTMIDLGSQMIRGYILHLEHLLCKACLVKGS
jgi:hypothetical protein